MQRTTVLWLSMVGFALIVAAGCEAPVDSAAPASQELGGHPGWQWPGGDDDAVGLSLWWENGEVRLEDGTPKTVTLYEDFPRYVQELDITSTILTDTDQGIQPIIDQGDMAGLDWRGVHFVEEDWRPAFDGTFSRSRFYRGARWMERPSSFFVVPLDGDGHLSGSPIMVFAGLDDQATPIDGGFIRRFVARQVTHGCPAIGDCTGATTFIAQGLVQLRDPMQPELQARRIPDDAESLLLVWSADLTHGRSVSVEHGSYADTPWTYGFDVELEIVNPPANGAYYMPGEAVQLKASLVDGDGNQLHPEGTLPSYGDFVRDEIASGIRYYDGLDQLLTLYYAQKHREGLTMWSIAGPTDRLRMPSHQVGMMDFFLPQTNMATVAEDGFTAIATLDPSMLNQADPTRQDLPNPDHVTFVLPADALPGTYVLSVKARRDWGGEAKNSAGVIEIQVGTSTPTDFQPSTGNCSSCHQGEAALSEVLHGLGDRRTCYSCHSSMAFEPDHALDYRIHLIHTRSDRFPADPNDCSVCHLDEPDGPPRGFPGIGPY